MGMKHSPVRRCLGVLVTSCFFFGSALAETVTLTPVAHASAQDHNLDGVYDTLLPAGSLFVSSFPTYNQRSIFEFTLPPELLRPQIVIQRATLEVPVLDFGITGATGWGMMHISGHEADDTLTIGDFQAEVNVQSILAPPGVDPDWRQRFDLTRFVSGFRRGLPNSAHMSLMAAVDLTNFYVQWDTNATLHIEYSLEPLPTLSVISPVQNSLYWTIDDIHLQASASDEQDGNLDAAIQWTLIGPGPIEPLGSGGDLTVNLPDGFHRIEISVTDSDGNVVRDYRDIEIVTLGNHRPGVWIDSPGPGQIIDGMPTTLRAWALDLEDGVLDQNIVWTNEQGDVLGEGGTLTRTLPVGAHLIFATVTDSSGLEAVTSITVYVAPLPNYCTVGTTSVAQGWIAKISVNGVSKASASDGGYADFTDTTFPVARDGNTIVLTAGGRDRTKKYWSVRIDLNRDSIFSPNETLVGIGPTTALSSTRTFTIPVSATFSGSTRMRVGVTYLAPPQACGVSNAGEFEDYTVVIPPPTP